MVKQYMERRQGSSDPKCRSVEDKPLSCAASLLSTIRKFKTFNGTASRRECAWWLSINLVMALILRTAGRHHPEILYAGSIWSICIMLPTLAVGSRRLHDAGHRWHMDNTAVFGQHCGTGDRSLLQDRGSGIGVFFSECVPQCDQCQSAAIGTLHVMGGLIHHTVSGDLCCIDGPESSRHFPTEYRERHDYLSMKYCNISDMRCSITIHVELYRVHQPVR
jgi:hypothetical protein